MMVEVETHTCLRRTEDYSILHQLKDFEVNQVLILNFGAKRFQHKGFTCGNKTEQNWTLLISIVDHAVYLANEVVGQFLQKNGDKSYTGKPRVVPIIFQAD